MSIRYLKKHAALEGVVGVEDAETLAQWLQVQRTPTVHLGKCEHMHGAVLQVLLALRPRVSVAPAGRWLAEALATGAA